MIKRFKTTAAAIAIAGVVAAGGYVSSASNDRSIATTASPSSQATSSANAAQPAFWHLVLRIVTTKVACENLRRVMPNSGDLKCLKAGSVYVIIPKGLGW